MELQEFVSSDFVAFLAPDCLPPNLSCPLRDSGIEIFGQLVGRADELLAGGPHRKEELPVPALFDQLADLGTEDFIERFIVDAECLLLARILPLRYIST